MKLRPALLFISLYYSIFLPCTLAQSFSSWRHPSGEYRMKTWWFFGYGATNDDGIVADVKALREAGFGGVVYYDQNHFRNPKDNDAEDGFSPEWWRHLKLAANEAQKAGLTFEINISNGYVAGGKWINTDHAMRRVASDTCRIVSDGVTPLDINAIKAGLPSRPSHCKTIALMALPCKKNDDKMRHFTARYKPKGKGRNGAMQRPDNDSVVDNNGFRGYGFNRLPDIGVLQVSDDSIVWCDVMSIKPMYAGQGAYPLRTNAFVPTSGKHWRVMYSGTDTLRYWSVGTEAKLDRWEECAALHSDFADGEVTPDYDATDIIRLNDIIRLDGIRSDCYANIVLPEGTWTILWLYSDITGAKSKHGRQNLLGYECDKLSVEAANLHWDSYVQPILDSLRSANINNVCGVTMDSHEGGSQNWTPLMLDEFKSRRGYDLAPYLPVLAGYIVESKEKTIKVLKDLRRTISDCMTDNYYGTFQKRASENGLVFTAQAIGNALCITGDAIAVKKVVDKPQGEFWTYQRDGAYDVKDCSSAAHLYGKPIASAEAMTDAEYKDNPADLKHVADIAFAFGAQEFVVCATPHMPDVSPVAPYVAGREYAINRSNPKWNDMKPVWEAAARSMYMLRQGKAAPDVLIYLGDDVPIKTLTHRLPEGLQGLDWDVCTTDAMLHCTDYIRQTYKAVLVAKGVEIPEEVRDILEELERTGITTLDSGTDVIRPIVVSSDNIVHTHRTMDGKEMFFLANIGETDQDVTIRFIASPRKIEVWRTRDGSRERQKALSDGTFVIRFQGNESVFVLF